MCNLNNFIEGVVNGKRVHMLLDYGAAICVVSPHFVNGDI